MCLDPAFPVVLPQAQHTRDVLLIVSTVWVGGSLLNDRCCSRDAIEAVLSPCNELRHRHNVPEGTHTSVRTGQRSCPLPLDSTKLTSPDSTYMTCDGDMEDSACSNAPVVAIDGVCVGVRV